MLLLLVLLLLLLLLSPHAVVVACVSLVGLLCPEPITDGDDTLHLRTFGDLIVRKDMTAAEVKALIASKYSDAGAPDASLMRLRELTGQAVKPSSVKLGKVFVDGKTLAANFKPAVLNDGKQVAVQVTSEPEVVKETDILVSLRRWHPEEQRLAVAVDRCLDGSATMEVLLTQLATGNGIDMEHLRVAKPWTWQLKNADELARLKWKEVS